MHQVVSELWLLSLAEAINPKYIPLTQTHPTYKEPDLVNSYMATPSQTLEKKYEQLTRENAEKEAQLAYLRKQMEQLMRRNRRTCQGSTSSSDCHPEEEEGSEHTLKGSRGDENRRE